MDFKMFDEDVSRRGLIKGAAGIAGIAALTAGGLGFFSKAEAAKKGAGELPFPYKKFTEAEIKEAGNIAHDNWFKGFCSYAALSGGLTILRRKVGEPYTFLRAVTDIITFSSFSMDNRTGAQPPSL